jgi:DNA-binding beta-propeller fold protein YncE
MTKLLQYLITAGAVYVLSAQAEYVPVNAPYAQNLVLAAKKAHPELQKLGLHAIAPGQQDYAIVGNNFPSKIGKKSSASDLAVIKSGKPSIRNNEAGRFFDLCLPLSDVEGRPIGITVMEIPYTFASNAEQALAKATTVRDELRDKITNNAQLFEVTSSPLKAFQTVSLPAAVKGRFDHFGVDLKHNRLFATAEGYHAVLVFDLVTAEAIAEIRDIPKPHAIYYRDDLDRIYVTDGETGALKIFDGKTYKLLESVALAKDADAIGYEPSRQYLYVVSGGKDAGQPYSLLSVVDTNTARKMTDIRIEGETLEAMALDIWRPRMYVNNRAKNEVTVVDRQRQKVTGSWPVTMGKDNVAMALDEQHQRLFVGCRSGHVVVFDSNTGKELQTLAIAKGVDDLEYDAATKRLYAIGGGAVSMYEETDADHFKSLGTVAALPESKTARLVPQINRYFVAAPGTAASGAAIQVFQPLNFASAKPAAALEPQPVRAPFALELARSTMSEHPDLRKMGLHAVPPGGKDSVIIANYNTVRIGLKSSDSDRVVLSEGKTICTKKDDGSYYGLKLPLQDASGHSIGILVMEMPFTSAADEAEAISKAQNIRHEVGAQISDFSRLFQ